MKILHLTAFLQGGAGRIIVELAREQQRLGHEVTVVASRRGAARLGNDDEYLDVLKSIGIPAQLLRSTFERTQPNMVAAAAAINQLMLPGQSLDVIHAHAAMPSLIALLLAGVRRTAVGIIQTVHGWGETKTIEQCATDVGVLNLIDRVAVPSTYSAALLTGLGVHPEQIAVIPYGVGAQVPGLSEADEATWIAMARARRSGRPVVACVGTIAGRNNQALIVEAVATLDTLNPLCVFIGEGDDRPLRGVADRLRCADRVRVHGHSRSARVLASGADVLVVPSRRGGQSLAILEAFCDGLLVATSDLPELAGPGGLIEDGITGFRFRSEEPQSLAETLTRVAAVSNSGRRAVRAAARDRYTAEFTLTRMVERYSHLYADLGRRKPHPRRRPARSAA